MKKLIAQYEQASIYKIEMYINYSREPIAPPRYYIEAQSGIFYYSSAVEHQLEQRDINEDEAIAIAKKLIDKHIKSQEDEYAEFFRLYLKPEPEPTWFEIEQAAGEIPTDRALHLDNLD